MNVNEKKHNYFYKITNLVNGKYYYGIHSTNNLKDSYMGGGKALKKAYNKYGKKNFIKEIIANYPTRHEASEHERTVVTIELILDENCYNLKTGGLNDWSISNETKDKLRLANIGKKLTEEHKQKIKESCLGRIFSPESKLKMSIAQMGKIITAETREKISKSNTGRIVSEETRQKISNSERGKFVSSETRLKMSKSNTGRKRTQEVIAKMSKSKKIQCIILDMLFDSIKEAAKHFNIQPPTVSDRIKSNNPKWSDWNYYNGDKNG